MIGNRLREKLPPGLAYRLRQARWRVRRVSTGVRYGRNTLHNAPILFGNSFPKSGTHLLFQVLHAFPQIGPAVDRGMGPILTFVPETGRKRVTREILGELQTLQAGDLCFGHMIAESEIVEYMHSKQFAHIFILRDPRDVVISHAFFLADKAINHVHHAHYQELASLDERIRVSILGRPEWHNPESPDGDFPDIGARFEPYLGWLSQPDVLVLHFEDFILTRPAALARLLEYAVERGFQLQLPREQAYEILNKAIDPKSSFTFRGGRVGDWQKHFTDEHKDLFKRSAGDLLIRLGYEQDESW